MIFEPIVVELPLEPSAKLARSGAARTSPFDCFGDLGRVEHVVEESIKFGPPKVGGLQNLQSFLGDAIWTTRFIVPPSFFALFQLELITGPSACIGPSCDVGELVVAG